MNSCNYRQAAAAVVSLVLIAATAQGAEPVTLLARSGWVRFHVVLGRIEVANIPSSQTRTATSDTEGRTESLTITADTDVPSVNYELTTVNGTVAIRVIDGDRVEIQSSEGGNIVSFRQIHGADIDMGITISGKFTRYRAKTLWHLMISEPGACRAHLLPLLELMRPAWRLDETLSSAADEIFRNGVAMDESLRSTVRLLIARLDHPDFATREESQRKLVNLGIGVLPHLQRIPRSELSREQRRRLDFVRASLRCNRDDSAAMLALWLSEDEQLRKIMLTAREQGVALK